MYNWQFQKWPNFTYNVDGLQNNVVAFAKELGEIKGLILGLPEKIKQEPLLEIMISEAIKTSEIEGEYMSREDVMSSIKNNLGLHKTIIVKDKRASGIAQLMIEVRNDIEKPLTIDIIQHWHNLLMEAYSNINGGKWRVGEAPMQIISGAYGREVVHYEAPPSNQIPEEMEMFLSWYSKEELPLKEQVSRALLKSAIVHLYFESIHPFEDGNGRIGRALAEYTLSQGLKTPVLLSISNSIEKNKKSYYEHLKEAQRSLDITEWISYFVQVILDAQKEAKELVQFTLKKAQFFDEYTDQLNDRQLKVINRILEKGIVGFEGGMTAKKYMSITKTSKATATRDLQQLQESGVLASEGAGRSVRYKLNFKV